MPPLPKDWLAEDEEVPTVPPMPQDEEVPPMTQDKKRKNKIIENTKQSRIEAHTETVDVPIVTQCSQTKGTSIEIRICSGGYGFVIFFQICSDNAMDLLHFFSDENGVNFSLFFQTNMLIFTILARDRPSISLESEWWLVSDTIKRPS